MSAIWLPGASRRGRAAVFDPMQTPWLTSLTFSPRGTAVRASQPALLAAGRVIAEKRDCMVSQWEDWLGDRITTSPNIPRSTVEREFRLIIDAMNEMVGPFRRE